MKKTMCVLILLAVGIALINLASANVLSDPVFHLATTNLTASKTAVFTAITNDVSSSIRITRVQLYMKNGNSWQLIGDLPVPTDEATDFDMFSTNADYSGDIGTGTYRLLTTFCADGYSISRYSNIRTF